VISISSAKSTLRLSHIYLQHESDLKHDMPIPELPHHSDLIMFGTHKSSPPELPTGQPLNCLSDAPRLSLQMRDFSVEQAYEKSAQTNEHRAGASSPSSLMRLASQSSKSDESSHSTLDGATTQRHIEHIVRSCEPGVHVMTTVNHRRASGPFSTTSMTEVPEEHAASTVSATDTSVGSPPPTLLYRQNTGELNSMTTTISRVNSY